MKFALRLSAVALVVALTFAGSSMAQFDVNGPNAALTINGQVPSNADPTDHDISVAVPGFLAFVVDTGANAEQGVIVLTSPINPTTGNVLDLSTVGFPPGSGSIDIGAPGLPISNVAIMADGIAFSVNPTLDPFFQSDNGNVNAGTNPQMVFNVTIGAGFCGQRNAYQCLVQEPGLPPFFLDMTEAADLNYVDGQELLALTGDDGTVNIAFSGGKTFPFHGVSYTDINITGNGLVSFGAPTSIPAAGFTIDAVAAINAEPAIFAGMADWSPNLSVPGGVIYSEAGETLRIVWDQCPHFADGDTNTFDITMHLDITGSTSCATASPGAGDFGINFTSLDPAAVNGNPGLLGHTPGGAAVISGGGMDRDLNFSTHVSAATNEVMVEEHNNLALTNNASVLGHDGLGSPMQYNNIQHWNGQSANFLNLGGGLYLSQSNNGTGSTSEDVLSGPNSIQDSGNETVVIVGKFAGFTTAGGGQVIFDPAGAAVPWGIVGVYDDTATHPNALAAPGPDWRPVEGLVCQTQAGTIPSGNAQVDVIFDNGNTYSFTVNVVAAGSVVTSYTLGDDTSVLHNLTAGQSVTHYGTAYTSFNICSNGFLTFAAGSGDFTETMAEFFDGWLSPPNPGIAVAYSDLNRGGTGSGATYDVTEDTVNNITTVSFTNQNWWSSQDPAGTFTCAMGSLGPGSVVLDYTAFTAAISNTDNMIFGVTDGDTLTGTDTDLSDGLGTGTAGVQGTYSSSGMAVTLPDSIGENVPANVAPLTGTGPGTAGGIVQYLDVGAGPFGDYLIL